MAALKQGTLLKAKDGSKYVVFRYYVHPEIKGWQKKCDTPTSKFRGVGIGQSLQQTFACNVEDFRLADAAEQELITHIIELREKDAEVQSKNESALRNNQDISRRFADVPGQLSVTIDAIDNLVKGIEVVMLYTGKTYVDGSTLRKELGKIENTMKRILAIIPEAAQSTTYQEQQELVDSRY